ncbi:peroxisomal multifunctional enzyme type 2 isoform X1 [Amyelois transitella]|uniref:peroxisomal multifunctional enzyme type 2 isoform X1 n=2 Tax=Amyelois transitella TaxID=680683 RepID=UPI0029907183|nr:peroxisomal multifunctional enzyme type 2 isoform X1 [Amyelois transitella]XP_060805778.1 peroxisomal multifunctional enzyme type 2 isoform X1 [Amyelois transitella]
MDQLRFDGRVAVVTGAGGGLGKAYALLLGSRGAKVVVNDLGSARDGAGKSNFADAVVKEIKDKGGEAVADYNSVVEGEKIIKTALDNYGRIDILINNAGILRDKSFQKMSDQDWDLIQAVHLKGAFKTTQAAWESFKKQNFGRVIMTSSNAGIFGNFGQANYSAAKLGLVGLANTLSIEGAKYNIKVNTIVPTAASRLTEDILPPDMFEAMKPELIAPVVAYMVHESFEASGEVIDSTLGYATKTHFIRSNGTPLKQKPSDPVTIESVREFWPKVVDMKEGRHIDRIAEVTVDLVEKLQEFEERSKLDANGRESYWSKYSYNAKDLALYALGVGASVVNPSDLKFLYESDEQFVALPTFFILAGMCMEAPVVPKAMPPGKHADFTNILHGEQYIEFVEGFPGTEGAFETRTYVVDILDKGSSAVAIVNSEIYQDKTLIYKTQQHIFVVGQGGFGGPRVSKKAVDVQPVPKRAPDATVEQKTSQDQAALYRLSGDLNPLHIDPNVAKISGYERPILHGLSSLGFAARHVLAKFGNNDPLNVKALKARFAKPVLPGQTLVTEMWADGKRVHFQTKVKENGTVVIAGAYMDFKNNVGGTGATPALASSSLKSDALFAKIIEEVSKNPAKAKSVNGVFLYNITENGKTVKKWTLDLKSGDVYEGEPKSGKADTTMTVSDADLIDIAAGTTNPQVAFMKGKLKISGNIMLAQKLGPLLKSEAKL